MDCEQKDDDTIPNDCLLLRRVPYKPDFYIIWDDNKKSWRPSSAAFRDHPNGSDMSIVLGCILELSGRPYTDVLVGHDSFSLAAITTKVARDNGQKVIKDPLPQEPAHGLVAGDKKKASKNMAREAQWIVPAPDPHK